MSNLMRPMQGGSVNSCGDWLLIFAFDIYSSKSFGLLRAAPDAQRGGVSNKFWSNAVRRHPIPCKRRSQSPRPATTVSSPLRIHPPSTLGIVSDKPSRFFGPGQSRDKYHGTTSVRPLARSPLVSQPLDRSGGSLASPLWRRC